MQCTGVLNWTVRTFGETEAIMNCCERILGYIHGEVPQEAERRLADVPKEWPENGDIEFDNVCVRYRAGLPLVLENISLKIDGGWRVGIVGRTGSGKSTTILAMLRLVEPAQGCVRIGGRSTSEVGLADLRSKIAVVPQDPVLWTGSLRKNLDPFKKKTDEQVWECLTNVNMKKALEDRFPGKTLDEIEVAEGGENFSHGQRQLFSIARAALMSATVVLLDEATSALDEESDALVQKALRTGFVGATMLVVAHRIRTIADSDRVLVLHNGKKEEFESPKELLADARSRFSGLVDELGAEEKALVYKRAGMGEAIEATNGECEEL